MSQNIKGQKSVPSPEARVVRAGVAPVETAMPTGAASSRGTRSSVAGGPGGKGRGARGPYLLSNKMTLGTSGLARGHFLPPNQGRKYRYHKSIFKRKFKFV